MKIICTVGTSLFVNFNDKHPDGQATKDSRKLRNKPAKNWDDYKTTIERLRNAIYEFARETQNASAEIASLQQIYNAQKKPIEITLLASDTILSRLAAEILCNVLQKQEGMDAIFDCQSDIIPGLQVNDHSRFEKEGMPNLFRRIDDFIGGYPDDKAINMTGGFKATIPYLTILAHMHNVPLYYIFDGETAELINIPLAPFTVNWGMFAKYHSALETLSNGIENWPEFKLQHSIGDDFNACLFFDDDGFVGLNAIGELFWQRYRTYFICEIQKGYELSRENAGNRSQIERALQELYKRLLTQLKSWQDVSDTASLIHKITSLGDKNDLRHGKNPAPGIFIFKSTDQAQIRLVYSPLYDNRVLSVKLFEYKRGNFDHSSYIGELHKKYSNKSVQEFTQIIIKKPEV